MQCLRNGMLQVHEVWADALWGEYSRRFFILHLMLPVPDALDHIFTPHVVGGGSGCWHPGHCWNRWTQH
jgi:hypothetical protein